MKTIDVEREVFTAMWLKWLQSSVGLDFTFLMVGGSDARSKSKSCLSVCLELTQNLDVRLQVEGDLRVEWQVAVQKNGECLLDPFLRLQQA